MGLRRRLSGLMQRTMSEVRRVLDEPEDEPPTEEVGARDETNVLEERVAQLEKRVSMMMGAIQATTAQLTQVKTEVAQAQNEAKQAMQRATTAQTTAEAAADGVSGSEAQLGALMERLGRAGP
ncbi:MAG: hypothetical protein KTR31_40330 [Myxococcales bacterium]|nr:hypothetical protein [Myxococcales bacterium]